MLFRKNILTQDTIPTGEKKAASLKNPVCIVGSNALACLLAARFSEAGENVILMAGVKENANLSANGITLKEDYQLQKRHYKFKTALWLKDSPRLLIIAEESPRIKAALTGITPSKIKDCPAVSFTRLKDPGLIRDILGIQIIDAYFDGWLRSRDQQIIVYGRTPQISLCCPDDTVTFLLLQKLLEPLKMPIIPAEDSEQCFWDYFCLYAPCSLLTAMHGKNVFELIKNKTLREQLHSLVNEICRLAPSHINAPLADDVIKKIFNIPSDYLFPLQTEISRGNAGDIDFISTILQQASINRKQPLPETASLLKQVYQMLLKSK